MSGEGEFAVPTSRDGSEYGGGMAPSAEFINVDIVKEAPLQPWGSRVSCNCPNPGIINAYMCLSEGCKLVL